MNILILIAEDLYTRSFLQTDALSHIKKENIYLLLADRVVNSKNIPSEFKQSKVTLSEKRERRYAFLRTATMFALRRRSSTFKIKTSQLQLKEKVLYSILGLPGIFTLTEKLFFKYLGFNHELFDLLNEIQPDIVIAPTAGTDGLVLDLVREARRLRIPSLLLVNGWDNLSSKATFSVKPSYFGVWGEQSIEDLLRIHNFNTERARPLGVPTFDHYFSVRAKTLPNSFGSPYLLFAGSALAFDELAALKFIDDYLAKHYPQMKVVYRPHPWRQKRLCNDNFFAEKFTCTIIDPQVLESYEFSINAKLTPSTQDFLPSLDYYPSLLKNSCGVISPLSTMIVEASIFNKNVLVLAYNDRVHTPSMDTIARFTHFRNIEKIPNYTICRSRSKLSEGIETTINRPEDKSAHKHILPWLFFDQRTYGERLKQYLDEIYHENV